MTSVAILNRIRISRQTLVTALTAKLTTTGEATRRITKKKPEHKQKGPTKPKRTKQADLSEQSLVRTANK